jgi:hypothetical protein
MCTYRYAGTRSGTGAQVQVGSLSRKGAGQTSNRSPAESMLFGCRALAPAGQSQMIHTIVGEGGGAGLGLALPTSCQRTSLDPTLVKNHDSGQNFLLLGLSLLMGEVRCLDSEIYLH